MSGKKYVNKGTRIFKNGKTKEVLVYKEKKPLLIAQNIAFINVIILNADLENIYSKDVQEFVLEHEYAHSRLFFLISWIWLCLILIFGLFFVGSLMTSLTLLILILVNYTKYHILFFNSLISLIVSLLVTTFLSWIEEFRAEKNAIKTMGIAVTEKVYTEMDEKRPKRAFYYSIIGIITHPPKTLVLKICKYLYKKKQKK